MDIGTERVNMDTLSMAHSVSVLTVFDCIPNVG